jgi:hypothetical protein
VSRFATRMKLIAATTSVYALICTSFPHRIKYCDQEIVIFREDILNRLFRNCVVPPSNEVATQTHLVRTIIDGAHLCPLPLTTRQVSWAYDHALRIYPVPDAVSRSFVLLYNPNGSIKGMHQLTVKTVIIAHSGGQI